MEDDQEQATPMEEVGEQTSNEYGIDTYLAIDKGIGDLSGFIRRGLMGMTGMEPLRECLFFLANLYSKLFLAKVVKPHYYLTKVPLFFEEDDKINWTEKLRSGLTEVEGKLGEIVQTIEGISSRDQGRPWLVMKQMYPKTLDRLEYLEYVFLFFYRSTVLADPHVKDFLQWTGVPERNILNKMRNALKRMKWYWYSQIMEIITMVRHESLGTSRMCRFFETDEQLQA